MILEHGSKPVSFVHQLSTGKLCVEEYLLQVSAVAMDPSGTRVVTGGYDYDVRLWDLAGMDSTLRTIRPCAR